MDRAIAMSLGGISICATDSRLKSSGYWEFGLRCPSCQEAVYCKSGWSTKSHFAHFPETPSSQACPHRVTSTSDAYGYGSSISFNESSILLKDIHGQLIKLLLHHNKEFLLNEINVASRDEIQPNEVEQNILNLLTHNKHRNLVIFNTIFENYKESEDEIPFWIEYKTLRNTNCAIGKEILGFVTSSTNKPILYAMVSFYKGRESDEKTIQLVRRKVIESIAIKNWYVILKHTSLADYA